MVTFRSNSNYKGRRPAFRNNNNRRPSFRRNDDVSNFPNRDTFQRKSLGGNNHNVAKLIEKYNDLAREALANEDKILSENYFQHADHFTRVQKEQEDNRISRISSPPVETAKPNKIEGEAINSVKISEEKKSTSESEHKETIKTDDKKVIEKKSAAS